MINVNYNHDNLNSAAANDDNDDGDDNNDDYVDIIIYIFVNELLFVSLIPLTSNGACGFAWTRGQNLFNIWNSLR